MVHREEQINIEVSEYSSNNGSISTPNDAPTSPQKPVTDEGSEQSITLSCSTDKNNTIAIALIDGHSFTRECITGILGELFERINITLFANFDDCINCKNFYDVILYYDHKCGEGYDERHNGHDYGS